MFYETYGEGKGVNSVTSFPPDSIEVSKAMRDDRFPYLAFSFFHFHSGHNDCIQKFVWVVVEGEGQGCAQQAKHSFVARVSRSTPPALSTFPPMANAL